MADRSLKKGIIVVFIANLVNVVFSLGINFMQPKLLSINNYAAFKTFQLYISYVGLLHFGYVDGMYLRWGGKNLEKDIDRDLSSNLSTMKIFQIVVSGILLMYGTIVHNLIFILFSLTVFPVNMNDYYKYLFQATGEFSYYGRAVNLTAISIFIINVVVLLVAHNDNATVLMCCYVILYYTVWLILERNFRKNHELIRSKLFSVQQFTRTIREGFLLTIGNLASMLLTSMDRWFVKVLQTNTEFAQYSFAVSVENFLNMAITPITITLYDFFCRNQNKEKRRDVLAMTILFAALLPSAAFPVKLIVTVFLPNYSDSLSVIYFLFASQMFYIINRAIYTNMYKAQKRQNRYFVKLIIILGLGFILNVICYWMYPYKEAFSIGTLLSAVVWLIIVENDFSELKMTIMQKFFLLSNFVLFLVVTHTANAIKGFMLYLFLYSIIACLFVGNDFKSIIKLFIFGVNKYVKRIKED